MKTMPTPTPATAEAIQHTRSRQKCIKPYERDLAARSWPPKEERTDRVHPSVYQVPMAGLERKLIYPSIHDRLCSLKTMPTSTPATAEATWTRSRRECTRPYERDLAARSWPPKEERTDRVHPSVYRVPMAGLESTLIHPSIHDRLCSLKTMCRKHDETYFKHPYTNTGHCRGHIH